MSDLVLTRDRETKFRYLMKKFNRNDLPFLKAPATDSTTTGLSFTAGSPSMDSKLPSSSSKELSTTFTTWMGLPPFIAELADMTEKGTSVRRFVASYDQPSSQSSKRHENVRLVENCMGKRGTDTKKYCKYEQWSRLRQTLWHYTANSMVWLSKKSVHTIRRYFLGC